MAKMEQATTDKKEEETCTVDGEEKRGVHNSAKAF